MDKTQIMEQKVLEVSKRLEKEVDAAIEHIDNLDINDLEQLRKQRIQEYKSQQGKRQHWLQSGHGSYEQLSEEKMFFDVIKKSDNVVMHFFTPNNTRSPILDKHLKILAPKHVETKFVSLNAEKCPFLAARLHIKTIPTVLCIQKSIVIDKVVGFTSLGNTDEFTTEVLEWRLAQNNILNYDGDLSVMPTGSEKKEKVTKRSIRDGIFANQSDDDLDQDDYSKEFEGRGDNVCHFNADYNKFNPSYLTPEEELELGISDDENEKK